MLNVKYIVELNESNSLSLRINEKNLGDAWFIENIIQVENNDEILLLDNLNYSKDCISKELKSKNYNFNSDSSVELISRKSNELIYEFNSKSEGFIVFSEAFYSKGWNSYIENKPTCTAWNSGNALIGIQNIGSTQGLTPPNRNTGPWSATAEAWRFTPNGISNYIVEWFDNSGFSQGFGDTLNVCTQTQENYTAEITYNNNILG